MQGEELKWERAEVTNEEHLLGGARGRRQRHEAGARGLLLRQLLLGLGWRRGSLADVLGDAGRRSLQVSLLQQSYKSNVFLSSAPLNAGHKGAW